jgi:hypothetical protein
LKELAKRRTRSLRCLFQLFGEPGKRVEVAKISRVREGIVLLSQISGCPWCQCPPRSPITTVTVAARILTAFNQGLSKLMRSYRTAQEEKTNVKEEELRW